MKYSQILVMSLDTILSKIKARYDHAIVTRSIVECGGTWNLDTYINSLNTLYNMVADFKTKYENTIEKYENITRDFKSEIYNKIVDNSKISEGVKQFIRGYEQK